MELFERRGYFFCQHCGSFHFLERADSHGVHVLHGIEPAAPCGVCGSPLSNALLDREHTVKYCERCRGALIPRERFARVVSRRRSAASGPSAAAVPIDPRELERTIICAACGERMDVHPYYGPGNVVIDTCSACDVIWLDFGELEQIENAPGRDRAVGGAPRLNSAPAEPTLAGRVCSSVSVLDLLGSVLDC